MFHPTSMRCFQTQVHSFALVRSVGSCLRFVCSGQGGSHQLMSSSIIWHLWLLGDHRGLDFQVSGLDFYSFVTLLLRLAVLRLPHFRHYSILSVPQCARVLPVGERTVLQRLPFDDWHFIYVSKLLYNDFCHRWLYYCSVVCLGVILFVLFFMIMTYLVWLLRGRNFRFLSWIVSVPVWHRSSFPCNLGLYFLLSLASFLRFERHAHSLFPCRDLW